MTLAPKSLLARTDAVVAMAAASYQDTPAAAAVSTIAERLHEPLRVAIAGKVKAGKSTLLNALVGEIMAPTDASECTRVVTWYRQGITYRAHAEMVGGTSAEIHMRRHGTGVELDLGGRPVESVARIVVDWPTSALRAMTLIDTPGVGSLSPGAGDRAIAFLDPNSDKGSPVDAVIYLTRHVHRGDVRFLEAFHDDAGGRATPVNALAVLSRADEIGGGRADSLASAAKIASRSSADPAMRRLCQTVVPVAGLVAEAAVTLTEAEYRALTRLVAAPRDLLEAMLLSVDRFTAEGAGTGLAPAERAHLLDRLGLFGVGLACDLLRHRRAHSARGLSEELRRRSGLDELKHLLRTRFAARSEVLKARSALLALSDVLHRWPLPDGAGDALWAELERVRSSAHELTEVRLLVAARAGEIPLDPAALEELERLLGSAGEPAERLGVATSDPDELRKAIIEGVGRWRGRAEHPLAPPSVVEASQVAAHALERLLADLPAV